MHLSEELSCVRDNPVGTGAEVHEESEVKISDDG